VVYDQISTSSAGVAHGYKGPRWILPTINSIDGELRKNYASGPIRSGMRHLTGSLRRSENTS